MSVRGKRLWAPRLDVQAALAETESFLRRVKDHNLLRPMPPTLYQAYMIDGTVPTEGFEELSNYLRFSPKDSPQVDRGRAAVVRLLAVAVKAHFFLAERGLVLNEPYVFVLPDVALTGQLRYGLAYPIEVDNRTQTLVVAEWDLDLSASRRPGLASGKRFPTVLPEQDYRWLQMDRWKRLAQHAKDALGSSLDRRSFYSKARDYTDLATFPYGTPMEYPREFNDDVIAAGAMWSPGIRRWFLPAGFDVDAVRDYLEQQLQRTAQQRHELRWWNPVPAPKTSNPTH